MKIDLKDLIRLSSWGTLFTLQIFFNLFPYFNFWLRVVVLSSFMCSCTFIWIRIVNGRSIKKKLNLDEKGVTVLTYVFMAVILVLFTRNSFREATILTGGALIIPIFEELFFRSYLLQSMVDEWPSFKDLPYKIQFRLFKRGMLPLMLTSILFTLVHDDVIGFLLALPFFEIKSLFVIILRVVFGITVGGLYLIEGRNSIIPTAFHIAFNLSYFLING